MHESECFRDMRKPNFGSVSIFKNPNRSQKVKPEISVSVAFLTRRMATANKTCVSGKN